MLGSPNGPAYGTRPKLVVMKVLCKLRWRKIRDLLMFLHSLHLHSFSALLSLHLSPSFSPISITVTSCIFTSVSPSHILFCFSSYLFILYIFSLFQAVIHFLHYYLSSLHLSFPSMPVSFYVFVKTDWSLICCLSFFYFVHSFVVFLRHSGVNFCSYLPPFCRLFAFTHTLIHSFPSLS